ncbi:MAG: multiheme c-type cytochrome [Blastocatellia bacterium]
MSHRINPIVIALTLIFAGGLASVASAQITPSANPVPVQIRPSYNYSEAYSCTACHFIDGANGDHMPEAVGVKWDSTANAFAFTGNGWLSSMHAQSNFVTTQNTFCAKCHSPLEADPTAQYKKGVLKNTKPIADGAFEAVTCATCHPSNAVAAQIGGRRLAIYQWGKDKTTAAAYKEVAEGAEDQLCMNCHINRHNTDNPAFLAMYTAGVRCIDCHMAVYGTIPNTTTPKREHDWKVGKNLPYSCGVEGSVIHCHPGFSVAGTLSFIPYIKEQHQGMPWPNGTTPGSNKSASKASGYTATDYMSLWQYLDTQARAQGQP